MRVLIMSTPAASHLTVMVPLAWALRAAGHEIVVAGQPDITGPAAAAGLSTAVIGDLFDATEAIRAKLPAGKRPNEAGRAQASGADTVTLVQPWLFHARYLTTFYLDFARQWRPDLVISDPYEFSAAAVAGILGVPLVHHRWDLHPVDDSALGLARTVLGARLARLGLDGELPAPALVIDTAPAALRLGPEDAQAVESGAPAGGPPVQPMRYVPYNGVASLPDWVQEPPGRPRVAVTFGALTAELNGIPLYRAVIDAIGGLDGVEALVTLPDAHRAELGPVGPGVRVVSPLPLTLFLRTCDAVVHHGGTGSSLTAGALGVPQLILPQLGNEAVWAEQMAATGAARAVTEPALQNDPEVLREALTVLLSDGRYAAGARRLVEEMAAMPAPPRVVDGLERLVAGAA
ncbi:nucleotide disphospho-sugar-binding domain-containing protein [Streptomyces sp. HD]|uniref:nucleotide disphospho-sugar-binding domain-containing protein n=1 Tax=Streptomyces sp. HD TaxID=3020892 RepID=UPI00232D669C|nr:nucleotide disphospho-sugar-binding domain-containing protein [Streptomyces sp. HD]MDC0772577.1 DUF1205 domain-containing protein [Streptomyces sp. HD]